MKDSRLIELLRTFTAEELKSFEKFLKSPFLKPPRNTILFFDEIVTYFPEYDIDRKVIYQKLFPNRNFNSKKMINLMFDLTKAAEDFLAYTTLKKNEVEFLLSLSSGYLDKKLYKHSMRVNEAIERKLKPGFSTTKDYASKLKRLTQLESAISVEFSDFKKLIAITEKLFEASVVQFIIDLANIQSIKTPIKSTHGGIIQNDLIDSVEKSFNIEKLISLIEKNKNIHPQIALHYYWLKIHKNPENTEYYFLLRDLFYNNLSEMDREEKSILFNFLINYCIQRFNIDFMRESFELYKKMIEYSAYSESENEYMQILMYRNLIQTCISLGETKWLRNFLSTYNEILSPNYQEDMKHLSYAYLYFTEKEFEKALVSISKINNEVFIFKADVRNLLLRVYYELEFFEQAYSLVDAFKHYLSKSKEISQVSRIVHNNYLNFYHRLLKIRTGNSKEHPEFVKSGLEVENKIINKKWLLEKLEKLTSFRKDKK